MSLLNLNANLSQFRKIKTWLLPTSPSPKQPLNNIMNRPTWKAYVTSWQPITPAWSVTSEKLQSRLFQINLSLSDCDRSLNKCTSAIIIKHKQVGIWIYLYQYFKLRRWWNYFLWSSSIINNDLISQLC